MAELRAYKSSGGQIELKHLKVIEPKYKLRKSVLNKVVKSKFVCKKLGLEFRRRYRPFPYSGNQLQ